MNWFVFVAGGLYALGAVVEAVKGNGKLTIIYLAYSVANFILARM